MTLVNTETGEIVEVSYSDVRRSIDQAKASLEEAAEQIVWQIERQAWTVLGYSDWNEMREAEYGGAAFMVPRADRPELLGRLRQSGLTHQDIADTAGVSKATVISDLKVSSDFQPPAVISNARGQQRPASYAPRPVHQPTVEEAVAEFPDLAYFTETGRASEVPMLASDLRRYRDLGELPERLETLRRSVALDKAKRDGTYQPAQPAPQPKAPACPTCGQIIRSTS